MSNHPKDPSALFVRDEKTGRYAFNENALRTLGIDPAEARDRGYPVKPFEEAPPDLAA